MDKPKPTTLPRKPVKRKLRPKPRTPMMPGTRKMIGDMIKRRQKPHGKTSRAPDYYRV